MEINVTLKEITLGVKSIERMMEVIEEELKKCIDIQIYIEEEFVNELKENHLQYKILWKKYLNSGLHYMNDRELKFGRYRDWDGNDLSNLISRVHLVQNCFGYYQICLYSSESIQEYIHYLQGMKQIIIIHAEK